MTTSVDDRRAWYLEAVKGSLVINHGLSGKEAERMLSDYRLQERLELYPSQMHFDTDDIADEIFHLSTY